MRGAERERVTSEDATKRHRVPEPDDSIQNNREGMELDKKKGANTQNWADANVFASTGI